MATTPILRITDGTTTINLLDIDNGYAVSEWNPQITSYKDGGVFQNSPLSDGRRLVYRAFDNATETMTLMVRRQGSDSMARARQKLQRMLERAANYWTRPGNDTPVWLEARAACETGIRYALVMAGQVEQDAQLYRGPFLQPSGNRLMPELTLVLERGHWLTNPPEVTDGAPIAGYQEYPALYATCYPRGTTRKLTVADHSEIQNLPTSIINFTFECWFMIDHTTPPTGNEAQEIAFKGRWAVFWTPVTSQIRLAVLYATTNAIYGIQFDPYNNPADRGWHHLAVNFDTIARTARIFLDGVERTNTTATPGVGAYTSDVGTDLFLGNINTGVSVLSGCLGWVRITRQTAEPSADFTPELRCKPPSFATGLRLRLAMSEGTGTAVDNSVAGAVSDGVLDNADQWGEACYLATGNASILLAEATNTVNYSTEPGQVFLANKHIHQNITNWHRITTGENLMTEALPQTMHLATGTTYYGISTTGKQDNPFTSLVLNITTAAEGTFTLVWEYWNGAAWTAIPSVVDGTNGYRNLGLNVVSWTHFNVVRFWATNNPITGAGSATGYWIRSRVSSGSMSTVPVQSGDGSGIYPYTIAWPYLEADEVPGDIPALAKILFGTLTNSVMYAGLRSVNRGERFSAYLNAGPSNPEGLSASLGLGTTQIADGMSATGFVYSRAADVAANTVMFRFVMDNDLTQAYCPGTYRVFMLCNTTDLTPRSFELRIDLRNTNNTAVLVAKRVVVDLTQGNGYKAIDMGSLSFPEFMGSATLDVQGRVLVTVPAFTFRVAGLILLPADEVFFTTRRETSIPLPGTADALSVLDSTLNKQAFLATREEPDGTVVIVFPIYASSGYLVYRPDTKTRVWIHIEADADSMTGSDDPISQLASARSEMVPRYLSLIGDGSE